MLGRYFIAILSLISIVWIFFVGYDLLDKKDHVSPQQIFTAKDGDILIINRTEEAELDKIDFPFVTQLTELTNQLLAYDFPNERLYISERRPIVIVELPYIWSKKIVDKYLNQKDLKRIVNSQGFLLRYKKNHLIFYKDKQLVAHEEIDWPEWDNKASASIIHLQRPLKSTNVYFKANGIVSYQTRYGHEIKTKKIDDIDAFAAFLPDQITDYHFYEKEYAFKSKLIVKSSPFYQWMEDGYVQFSYEGVPCLMSDYNKSVDPLQMLFSDTDEELNDLTNYFKGIQLLNTKIDIFKKGFYIGKVGDKVLISTENDILERILADYQLGNTLSLNKQKAAEFFAGMPRKVSERVVNLEERFSITAYKQLLIKTDLTTRSAQSFSSKNSEVDKVQNNASYILGGEVKQFLGNGKIVFALSSTNTLFAFSDKKEIWKKELGGDLLSELKLITSETDGTQYLLANTANQVWAIDALNGADKSGFPIAVDVVNPVTRYKWNNLEYYLAVSTAGELVQMNQEGKITRRFKLYNNNSVSDEVIVYKNGSQLIACISGQNKVQQVDVQKFKTLKRQMTLPRNYMAFKTETGWSFFLKEQKNLAVQDFKANKRTLSNSISLSKRIYRGKQEFLAYQEGSEVVLVSNEGNIQYRIKHDFSDLADFDFITLRNGNTYLVLLDGIENSIYIYDTSGKKITEKSFEGKNKVKLSDDNGLTITSTLNNNVIQHFNVIQK